VYVQFNGFGGAKMRWLWVVGIVVMLGGDEVDCW
jgi:hypothetical protein